MLMLLGFFYWSKFRSQNYLERISSFKNLLWETLNMSKSSTRIPKSNAKRFNSFTRGILNISLFCNLIEDP